MKPEVKAYLTRKHSELYSKQNKTKHAGKAKKLREAKKQRYLALQKYLYDKFGGRCAMCLTKVDRRAGRNSPTGATIDHIVPKARGGTSDRTNLQLACRKCNLEKGCKWTLKSPNND